MVYLTWTSFLFRVARTSGWTENNRARFRSVAKTSELYCFVIVLCNFSFNGLNMLLNLTGNILAIASTPEYHTNRFEYRT